MLLLLSLLVLAFCHPDRGASCLRADRSTATDAVAACVADWRGVAGAARVPVGWEVLIELVDIKGLNVGDDITAELTNVHITEVNVELAPTRSIRQRAESSFTLQVHLA